jgi:hypothetical protein
LEQRVKPEPLVKLVALVPLVLGSQVPSDPLVQLGLVKLAPVALRVRQLVKPVPQAPLVVLLEQPEKQVRLELLTVQQVLSVPQVIRALE